MSSKETGFTSRLGVLTATLGSAVGLGNLWKFPALTGENGGAAFVFIYILACFILGLPLIIAEISLGRKGQGDVFTIFKRLSPNTAWISIAWMGIASGTFLLAFYSDVAGWVITYLIKAIGGDLISTDHLITTEIFKHTSTTPSIALAGQFFFLAIIAFVVLFGVSKGIERVTKILLPLLTILLIIVAIKNLTLPGAAEGLSFLFKPDFSKVNSTVILYAVGLAFFKLSLGMATMLTYGAYIPKDQNIPMLATRVMFADLIISLIAGIAIFPAVFTYGFEVTDGPSLLFVTIPAVFASMPGGTFFTVIFFLLAVFATMGASMSLIEASVAGLIGIGITRKKAVLAVIAIMTFFGIFATLSLTPVLSHTTIFGKNIFSFYDFISSNMLMPLGGFLTAIFIGWKMNKEDIFFEVSNGGTLNNTVFLEIWYILLRYVVPVLIIVVLLNGLGFLSPLFQILGF
ncbi:MAG: sodium-dependent transporter [Desulfovibrionaceae bacterium]